MVSEWVQILQFYLIGAPDPTPDQGFAATLTVKSVNFILPIFELSYKAYQGRYKKQSGIRISGKKCHCFPTSWAPDPDPGEPNQLRIWNQCGGSGMFIPDPGSDFFPSRIRTVAIPDPGSASKNLSILTPKKTQKMVSKL